MILRAALFSLALTASAHAADSRIRTVPYDPGRVIALTGHLGYQMMIEFAEDERIEAVSVGDSLSWQVTPNRRATHLFVKPVEKASATNMTVITTQRAYAFELRAAEARGAADPAIVYVLRFDHPPKAAPPAPPPPPPPPKGPKAEDIRRGYLVEGDARVRPIEVFDDGRATWFRFPAGQETPAIFTLGRGRGEEGLVNWRLEEGYLVVDQLADRFVLRLGNERAVVRREAGR